MQKLNRKSIMFEVRKPDQYWIESEEHKVIKIWYSWNPFALVWEKDRKGKRPAWIDDRQFIWYERGNPFRQLNR